MEERINLQVPKLFCWVASWNLRHYWMSRHWSTAVTRCPCMKRALFSKPNAHFTVVWRNRLIWMLPKVSLPLLFSVVLCSSRAEIHAIVTHYSLASPNWFALENKACRSSAVCEVVFVCKAICTHCINNE